jgi:hypothetical protein
MTGGKNVLLLVGSPKGKRSTSSSLGEYLISRLKASGFTAQTVLAHKAIQTAAKQHVLITAAIRAHLMVLAFPLYLDSLPYPVTAALEIIAAQNHRNLEGSPRRFAAIANCGFPESFHNATALAICHQFADQCGWIWSGGLSLGGGGAINGQSLIKIKWLARNAVKSLDLTAQALSQDRPIPAEAVQLMAKPAIPGWLYRLIATWQFKRSAKHFGTLRQMYQLPFRGTDG